MNQLGNYSNIDITVYKDSHHGFDREGGLEINQNGYSFKDCMFDVNIEGHILSQNDSCGVENICKTSKNIPTYFLKLFLA